MAVRLSDLALLLGISNKEAIEKAGEFGFDINVANKIINDQDAQRLYDMIIKSTQQITPPSITYMKI